MTSLPEGVCAENALPIALKNEMHDGEATILCTLDEGGIGSYRVNVRKLKNSMDNKNMEITVTVSDEVDLASDAVKAYL